MAKQKSLMRRAAAVAPNGGPRGGYDRRKANRISLWVVVVVAIALAGYMALQLSSDPVYAGDSGVHVRALFGFAVQYSEVRELKLEKSPIATSSRIFGNDAFGLFREGEFEVDGLGRARVFLKNPNVSYVTIRTDDKNYAISLGSLEKDTLLYDRIKLGLGK